MSVSAPVALIILDGWGDAAPGPGNAISLAKMPNLDGLFARFPHTLLRTSGESVGLPDGQMGNSEVGHLNLGAGRIVYQELTRISRSIRTGDFFHNPVLLGFCEQLRNNTGALHVLGLVSDGGVHSHLEHITALVTLAAQAGVKQVHYHTFLDGRDTPPTSAQGYLKTLENFLREREIGDIATVSGRYYAMDRDRRWPRTEKAYQAIVAGQGRQARTSHQAVEKAYELGETDEFVTPTVIVKEDGTPFGSIRNGDAVIFANFRADRARQLTQALADPHFAEFERKDPPALLGFVTMTEYDATFPYPVVYPPQNLSQTLGEHYSRLGYRQLRIAETEKYAHVTYFFSGGREKPFENEERILIPSPRDVPTYDHKPEMSAIPLTDAVLSQIDSRRFDLIILNYANLDMVGHTGVIQAAIKACETVDRQLGRVIAAVSRIAGNAIITADHGNAECMIDPDTGGPHTAHTSNKVPCIIVGDSVRGRPIQTEGILADVAPTILDLAGLPLSPEMTGGSLLGD